MAPTNQAAWFPAEKVRPVQIGPAPYTPPGPGQIVVQNAAIAINHVECYKQLLGNALLGYTKYPAILGGDIAGTVVEVGPGVQRFSIGDRVVAAALALTEASNDPAEGGFQLYTLVREHMASPLPPHLPFEQACVLPLTLSTAAYGLFHDGFLALDMPTPSSNATTPSGNNNTGAAARPAVLITAGASSVGSNAVQLATAAGYDVVSTSSPKNFDYVRKLGAVAVVDYHDSATLVDNILAALGGRTLVGAYAIGNGAVGVSVKVLEKAEKMGGKKGGRFVASAMPFTPEEIGSDDVDVKFIDLQDSVDPKGPIARVFTDFLPQALASGQFVPAPEPLVVGKGLDQIQGAMDRQLQGLSAQKLVVTL